MVEQEIWSSKMIDPREDFLITFKEFLEKHLATYPATLFNTDISIDGVVAILKSNLPALVDLALRDVKKETK